jgi:hypothetical protein
MFFSSERISGLISICFTVPTIFIFSHGMTIDSAGHEEPCSGDIEAKACISDLNGFLFLKKFSFDASDGLAKSLEVSFVLTKNTSYLIKSCGSETNANVTIFDRDRKLVFSSTSVESTDDKQSLIFRCGSTSIYYINFEFDRLSKECFQSILAFRRLPNANASSSN